jgi:hypothetical protein
MVASTQPGRLLEQGNQAMPQSSAILSSNTLPSAVRRPTTMSGRIAHEALTLAIGGIAMVVLSLALYLVAPTVTRNAVVTAFLGFDQTVTTP